MRRRDPALCGASLLLLAAAASPAWAQTGAARPRQMAAAASSSATVGELVVTAQKREENIQNVGMSIKAASGDRLIQLGITDTTSLQKIVPGFEATPNYYGTIVYTIRGVGFQDTSPLGREGRHRPPRLGDRHRPARHPRAPRALPPCVSSPAPPS